jgi:hypothetical protein
MQQESSEQDINNYCKSCGVNNSEFNDQILLYLEIYLSDLATLSWLGIISIRPSWLG